MTKEKIEFICALLLLGWMIYKSIKSKRPRLIHGTILFAATMLWLYPFSLPAEAGFAIWGALGSWIVFQEARRQSKESSLWLVGIMLIGFTIVFLLRTLLEMKVF